MSNHCTQTALGMKQDPMIDQRRYRDERDWRLRLSVICGRRWAAAPRRPAWLVSRESADVDLITVWSWITSLCPSVRDICSAGAARPRGRGRGALWDGAVGGRGG